MKQFTYILGILFLASALMTACGTSNTVSEDGSSGSANEAPDENNKENPDETDGTEEPDSQTDEESHSQTITYTFDGSEFSESAALVSSPEQAFSMYTVPGFKLDSEEPGKDVLYLEEDSSIFMRIELIDESVNIEQLIETTTDQLAVVSSEVNRIEPSENVDLPNATKLEASNDEQIVTSYIKEGDFQWKITMFTTPSLDYRDAFLQMAKTITPK